MPAKSDYEPANYCKSTGTAMLSKPKHQAVLGHKSKIHYKMQARKDITFDHRLNPGTQHGFE
jgi:hypothetical protein